jgi:hypothetical protein
MKRTSRLFAVVILGLLLAGLPLSSAQGASDTLPLAYIGPGAGLGFLSSLLAVLMVVLVGLLGLILYPVKLMIRWVRRSRSPGGSVRVLGPDSMLKSGRA